MIFIETPVFTRLVKELLDDDAYAEFQRFLAEHPTAGDVIKDTGGLRKIRVARFCTKSSRAKVRQGKNRRGSGVYEW